MPLSGGRCGLVCRSLVYLRATCSFPCTLIDELSAAGRALQLSKLLKCSVHVEKNSTRYITLGDLFACEAPSKCLPTTSCSRLPCADSSETSTQPFRHPSGASPPFPRPSRQMFLVLLRGGGTNEKKRKENARRPYFNQGTTGDWMKIN